MDGSKAVVYVLGAQHNGAKTVHDGHVLATVETNERDAGLDANDLYTVLSGQRCDQPPGVQRPPPQRLPGCVVEPPRSGGSTTVVEAFEYP
ncbi:hypothetical protein [Streptomyces sp. NPDC056341]|uniref:hypothetical protein n=1 Tax=unclassified Streptomyces TaxID=2593676 RepID=UPI0035DDF0A3